MRQKRLAQARQLSFIVVALLVAALLLLIAGSLSDLTLRRSVGTTAPLNQILQNRALPPPSFLISEAIFDYFRVFFWGSSLLAFIYLLSSRKGRRSFPQIMWGVLFMVVFGLIQLLVIRAVAMNPEEPVEITETDASPPEIADLPPLEEQLEDIAAAPDPPAALTTVLSVVFMMGLAVLAFTWWQRRPRGLPQQRPLAEIQQQASEAISELQHSDLPLADIIRRCYQEMARTVATERGLPRRQHITPREYEGKLVGIGLPQAPVQRLTWLFEQVRYGGFAPGQRERLMAVDSLQDIVAACMRLQEDPQPRDGEGPESDSLYAKRRRGWR